MLTDAQGGKGLLGRKMHRLSTKPHPLSLSLDLAKLKSAKVTDWLLGDNLSGGRYLSILSYM